MDEQDKLEVRRQLFHLILGLAISFFVYFTKPVFGDFITLLLLGVVFLLLLFPELKIDAEPVTKLLTRFERPRDREAFPFKGAIFYGIGITFPLILAPLDVACAIIAVLSVGDSMSTLVGKFYGKVRRGHPEKSLEGFAAFVIFAFLGASVFVSAWEAALTLALLGGIIEFFSFFDDNLLVPGGLTAFYLIYLHVIIPFNLHQWFVLF